MRFKGLNSGIHVAGAALEFQSTSLLFKNEEHSSIVNNILQQY